ncbi:DDE-type integrase/transposase/recombinase [Dechloromonas denitrificans]|nr:DDE-type integrase/transposase/recombinase [Dechloromonas denitrificans]
MPPEFSSVSPGMIAQEEQLNASLSLIEPLIRAFDQEVNLAPSRFSALIRAHAIASQISFVTLQRMVLRYYYFGRTRLALQPLTPGVKAGQPAYDAPVVGLDQSLPKRRGRQSILTEELGRNDFIVTSDDIADMVAALEACLRKGPTFKTTAHEEYLSRQFQRRHPKIYAEYLAGKRVEPVTLKQYRYYTELHARLSEKLAQNLRTRASNPGYLGSVRAAGPGEIYEIDSTGGRLHLVSSGDPPVLVGKPTIYLIIDRWSRFVVSAYLSLKSPSYEEVRYTLLIAFTSRETRFQALGVDISDKRWPIGRVPAVLCPDRGADFMSESMEQSVVQDLRIDLTPLPPLCPDGKAIVERLIRELKRRMASSGMKGVYADRPLDPISKRVARKSEAAAVHSLAEAYRFLIEIIDDHNHRPHTALRRRRILTQAGVQPVPKEAYLWGLEHISGLRSPPLTDADYQRLLLSVDTANIGKGVVRYKSRAYLPINEVAFDIAARSTARAKQISIRVDKTDPVEVFVPCSGREWAIFRATPGSAQELAGLTLDEEEAFRTETARIWARADHASRVHRVAAKSGKKSPPTKRSALAAKVSKQEQLDIRTQESNDLKRALSGRPQRPLAEPVAMSTEGGEDWAALEEAERIRNLEIIRRQRRKR